MANDVVPQEDGPPHWIEHLNLPKLVAGPAGEALSRLVAGATDIPLAWLEARAAAIRNKTKAQETVSSALAQAAADATRGNSELVQRATNTFLAKELRYQANKESVARKAVEYLKDEPLSKETPAKPDDDWLNVFERFAEQASSEKLQDLLARILAGEIRRPHSCSLRTLRFLSELDQTTAQLFEHHADAIVDNAFIPTNSETDSKLDELLHLQDYGLLAEVGGTLVRLFTFQKKAPLVFQMADRGLYVSGDQDKVMSIRCIAVTKVGQEVASILKRPFNRSRLDAFVKAMPKQNVARIDFGRVVTKDDDTTYYMDELLWRRPAKNISDQ